MIYLINDNAGESHYDIQEQADFEDGHEDQKFGFLNIPYKFG